VVEDPELAEALDRVAGEVPHRSRASLLRELALIGAETTRYEKRESALQFLLAIPGSRPARNGTDGLRRLLEEQPPAPATPEDPYGLSRALEEQREERL